jgi:hypothetical protein
MIDKPSERTLIDPPRRTLGPHFHDNNVKIDIELPTIRKIVPSTITMPKDRRRLDDCSTIAEVQQCVRSMYGVGRRQSKLPEKLAHTFFKPNEIERLLHRPGLKPYFKSARFGARKQIFTILLAAMDAEEFYYNSPLCKGHASQSILSSKHGDDAEKLNNILGFSRIWKTNEYRKFKRLFTGVGKYRDSDAMGPYAKQLVRRGFGTAQIVKILDAMDLHHHHRRTDPTRHERERRSKLKTKYVHLHKGKKRH